MIENVPQQDGLCARNTVMSGLVAVKDKIGTDDAKTHPAPKPGPGNAKVRLFAQDLNNRMNARR